MLNDQPLSNLHLEAFLNHKTLYYDKIDFSVVHNAWKILKTHIELPYVIHIVGTNGKGTTGRYLASYLHACNKKVLHYTSPHIIQFNERIWINGHNVSDKALEQSHQKCLKIFDETLLDKLTYFEYTTLLALYLSSQMDYVVLEAGLGGEFDATNVVENNLSLITTIGLDHTAFLGNTIQAIASTKMRSVDNHMIIGHQVHSQVYEHAKEVQNKKDKPISIEHANMDYTVQNLEKKLPTYLQNNLKLAIAALNYLQIDVDTKLFENIHFPGRCEKITNNITIDVGHNPLAANELLKEYIKQDKKIILIYNAYKDKDYESVLTILQPIIQRVEILKLDDKRIVNSEVLTQICDKLNIMSTFFTKIDRKQEYLVFGSFLVVEKFIHIIKEHNEK